MSDQGQGASAPAIASGNWKLVDAEGQQVAAGSSRLDFRGQSEVIVGGTPPHKTDSTGRVHTEQGASFYPSVFNVKWEYVHPLGKV